MKKLFLGSVALVALGTSAFAAEMAVPPPPPAPGYTWSGCYIGASAGTSFNQNTLSGIQIIGRKPHASTGLHGWIAFKNKAIRERSDLPHQPSLQSI